MESVLSQAHAPYFRETGAGPSVVCLHSSASLSGQWRALTERLADRFKLIAADLYGCGRSPAWPSDQPMHLDDELALLSLFLGAAIALKAALMDPERLISLVLYEPALFSVVMADAPQSRAAREIAAVRDDTIRLVEEGDLNASAQRFVDHWLGDGTWAAMPQERRPALAAAMQSVKLQWHAAFHEPTPLNAFAAVKVPTLFLTGTRSKASARAVARLLTGVLPKVRVEEIEGAGHMAPVTHPDRVNALIERFLDANGR